MPEIGTDRGSQFGILLLCQLLSQVGQIPPGTLSAIALQVFVFLGLVNFGWTNSPISSICLSGHAVLNQHEFSRIFTSALTHSSDMHLYYNMISLAWKGIELERRYGTASFVALLIYFTATTGFMHTLLAQAVSEIFHDRRYFYECAVGFSSVLFALKVLVNHDSVAHEEENFGFFSVPKKMAVWAELLLIQILVPNASFLGHLSGILIGILSLSIISTFRMASQPFAMALKAPGTVILSGLLIGLHFDLIPKLWVKRNFWSAQVCLSADHVIRSREYIRLISAPFEHASDVHFFICFISLTKKLFQLERKRNFLYLAFLSIFTTISTSVAYVITSFVASFVDRDGLYDVECVQGLSGTLFALKVLVLAENYYSFWSPCTLFELMEMLILLERRTLLFHSVGLAVGISILLFRISGSRFPGSGFILGRQNSPAFQPWTRSWGYARRPRPQYSGPTQRGSAYDNDADDDDEAVATNSESDEMVSTSDERFRSSERQRTRTSTSNSRDGYPPPPVSGGRYIEVDSQSESSPGTNTKTFLPYLNNP